LPDPKLSPDQLKLIYQVLLELDGRLDYLHTRVEKIRGTAEFLREVIDAQVLPTTPLWDEHAP